MDVILKKIRRYAYQGRVRFTFQAEVQRLEDGLSEEQVVESLIYAEYVRTKLSKSQFRRSRRERAYIIESFTLDGVLVYTKGVFRQDDGEERFYLLISAKRSRRT